MPANWDTAFAPEKQKYSNVTLAYIDILGFSNAVLKTPKSLPKRISRLVSELYDVLNSSRSGYLQTRLVSDSLIIWGPSSRITFGFVLEICSRIEETALLNRFLIRGAIVDGPFYSGRFRIVNLRDRNVRESSDEITLSPALIEAVRIEKKRRNPGIVIHKSCGKYCKRVTKKQFQKMLPSIHPFSTSSLELVRADFFNTPSLLRPQDLKAAARDLKKFHEIITQEMETPSDRVRKKWRYLAKNFNRICKALEPRLKCSPNLIDLKNG